MLKGMQATQNNDRTMKSFPRLDQNSSRDKNWNVDGDSRACYTSYNKMICSRSQFVLDST